MIVDIVTLTCHTTESHTTADKAELRVWLDDDSAIKLRREMNAGDVWHINERHHFEGCVKFQLRDRDEAWAWMGDDDEVFETYKFDTSFEVLGAEVNFGDHSQGGILDEVGYYDAAYTLVINLLSNEDEELKQENLSFGIRKYFQRMGRGAIRGHVYTNRVLEKSIYRNGGEVTSIRDTFKLHEAQDDRLPGNSIRQWIDLHCNFWTSKTIMVDKARFETASSIAGSGINWKPVKGSEKTVMMAGFQDYSYVTHTDNPFTHETRDWNWEIIPDPGFMYLLGFGMEKFNIPDAGCDMFSLVPFMHNEWETGSLPVQWRPFWGEYVAIWGRHIWDIGHTTVKAEIHPAHTIVREHATVADIGDNNAWIPVNRAIVAMGFSGGFPHDTSKRWDMEFDGGRPGAIHGDTEECWATNLKRHPVKFKLFPPVKRPSDDATLSINIKTAEHLKVNSWSKVDEFLELTQFDNPAAKGEEKAFRDWNDIPGFNKENIPDHLKPGFTLINDAMGRPAYFEVEIDLSDMDENDIPLAYYAEIDCGWNENTLSVQRYEVTFEKVKAISTDDATSDDDWHMYYGVNGQWDAWWTDNKIEEDETYTHNRKFEVGTFGDLPLILRDTGVEWNGFDFMLEKLDKIEVIAKGPDHFIALKNQHRDEGDFRIISPEVSLIDENTQEITCKVKGKGGDTRHEWTINIKKI